VNRRRVDVQPAGSKRFLSPDGGLAGRSADGDRVAAVLRDVVGYVTAQGTAVPGWKAAGVQVDVIAAEEVIVDVEAVVTMQDGAAAEPARAMAALLVGEYIKGLGIGVQVIASELIALVMAVEGVYNVVMSAPTTDVPISTTQKAMPGTVVIG